MHVIRDKNTQQTLYIDYRETAGLLSGNAVYPAFDPASMEVGWTDQSYVPAFYDIDQNGLIVEISLEEAVRRGWHRLEPTEELVDGKIVTKSTEQLIEEGILNLAAIKAQQIESYSRLSFELRAKLIPDYKLQNATLGIYEDDRLASYRATIQAFRNEVHRLEEAVENTLTLAELQAITPQFPDSIVAESLHGNKPSDKL